MSVTLTQTRVRPDDMSYDVAMIGINYEISKVLVRVKFASGDTRDIVYEGARLMALRDAVAQFSGLRRAIEQYVATTESGLDGTVS